MRRIVISLAAAAAAASVPCVAPAEPVLVDGHFVNWESPHAHPLDATPSMRLLLAVNTADNRLEVFSIEGEAAMLPTHVMSIPVGLDPVSVRARSEEEAWVVNRISDSISIVDLVRGTVRATLRTEDEPADVVFTHGGSRAAVSCAATNAVLVFHADELTAPPMRIAIEGLRPSALAVGLDGQRVFAAILESGNGSTILNGGSFALPSGPGGMPLIVSDPAGPHGGVNPPPNGPGGVGFDPPLHPSNTAIPVGLIVRKDSTGAWRDDLNADWTSFVSGPNAGLSGRVAGWDVLDHDVAAIDVESGSVVHYARRLMTMGLAIGVIPGSGNVALVGTEAHNQRRFESNLRGTFSDVNIAVISPDGVPMAIRNLNPQLEIPEPFLQDDSFRFQAIGDPRAVAFDAAGQFGFVAGMGSNNLVRITSGGARIGEPIRVGRGPTGLVVNDAHQVLYALNRFDATISVVSMVSLLQSAVVPMFDPTPQVIRVGRKHLFDTHHSSFTGHVSCATCHVDARHDRLAWDLGDPSLPIDPDSLIDQNLGAGHPFLAPAPGFFPAPFEPFSQMKGPMVTQTLQDIIGNEPFHWRGDRDGLEAFNPTFDALLGNNHLLTDQEMTEFREYLATITLPPNRFRTIRNELPTNLPLDGHFATGQFALAAGRPLPNGNAQVGLAIFHEPDICHGIFSCVECHSLPTGAGTDFRWNGTQYVQIPPGPNGERHRALTGAIDGQSNITLKIPQLRNMQDKIGMNFTKRRNLAGFGYNHDGSIDSIEHFMSIGFFNTQSDQRVADLTAFMLAFSGSDLPEGDPFTLNKPPGGVSHDTHAAVGRQITITDVASLTAEQADLVATMFELADDGRVGLVGKALIEGRRRGFAYLGGTGFFRTDHADEQIAAAALVALAQPDRELTLTVVVRGTQTRIGIDHDADGILDFDDPVAGPNPQFCPADFNQSGEVSVQDIFDFLAAFFSGSGAADFNQSGVVSVQDIFDFLAAFFAGC